jgi:hypothetical protein
MSCRIEAHCSRTGARFYRLHDLELSGRRFRTHRERAAAATGECLAAVDFCGVHTFADGQVRYRLAVDGAHDDQLPGLSATDEEALLFRVCGRVLIVSGDKGTLMSLKPDIDPKNGKIEAPKRGRRRYRRRRAGR